MKVFTKFLAVAILAMAIVSCNQKDVTAPIAVEDNSGSLKTGKTCGLEVYNLSLAPAFVQVQNTSSLLYLLVDVRGTGFQVKEISGMFGDVPFVRSFNPAVSRAAMIPIGTAGNFDCGSTYEFAVTAILTDDSELSYEGEYTVQCCCWAGETAWAEGTRYVNKGNWAMWVKYEGGTKEVKLMAGQHWEAGLVTFKPNAADPDNFVDINIKLITDFQGTGVEWRFNPGESENIKIQDYASTPPAKNPAPGKFDHKFFTDLRNVTVTVPLNNYYGVHADVEQVVACD